ncbi:MAG TPA: DUF1858 domain-containing protein [Anaerolineaceae bacterium]|nr:DUF1858 domain-containing protein [Anaerolineaceae bacterium]
MQNPSICPESIVADVLNNWPETVPVFLKHRMSCVGCSMSSFETLSDAVRIYNIPLDLFLGELHQVVCPGASR